MRVQLDHLRPTALGGEVVAEAILEKVEGRRPKDSILDGVPRALPPLERAYKVQKRAAKAGFGAGIFD